MIYFKNHSIKTISPAAAKAVGRYGRGLLKGHQPRAPDRFLEIPVAKPKNVRQIREKYEKPCPDGLSRSEDGGSVNN